MRKDLLALAERIRALEIELEKCPREDRKRRLGIWVEMENLIKIVYNIVYEISNR